MSRTDNTRPIDIVLKDPAVQHVSRNDIVLTGGVNSDKRHGKQHRKEATTRRRQHVRRTLKDALLLTHDPDLIDITPIRDDKRGVGWRYA